MDLLDLDDEVLKDVQKVMQYDSSIPLHYRILGKLNYNDDLRNCIRFIEANRSLFTDEYAYLMLESAVEMCLNTVVNENGELFHRSDLPKIILINPLQWNWNTLSIFSKMVQVRFFQNILISMNILKIWRKIVLIKLGFNLIYQM
ncbi:MAG: hypothetical protein IKL87_02700 [Oscillospiraceae bacterium]|nr:hypothetical protein [Oscillospiraceae bacterium]